MKKMFDVKAYDRDENVVDPTNGEYILASTDEEAIAEAMTIAEYEGQELHGFFVEYVEEFFTDEMFYYEETTDGFEIFADDDNEYIGFIYSYAENRDADREALDSCYDLDAVFGTFDNIDRGEAR